MKPLNDVNRPVPGGRRLLVAAAALVIGAAGPALGSAPRDPLPVPYYSFDAQSPTAINDPDIDAGAVLMLNTSGTTTNGIPQGHLGLQWPEDDVDGFSFNNGELPPDIGFVLLFSVNRATEGSVPPNEALKRQAEVPFNASDQAVRGHASGDGFLSLTNFDRNGIIPGDGRPDETSNNSQAFNNYDGGGSDFHALPYCSSRPYLRGRVPQDNVNGFAWADRSGRIRQLPPLYFSVATGSPSLQFDLPGSSPADIFYDPAPDAYGVPEEVFAYHIELGLDAEDDIDALIVFDDDGDGRFNGTDQVLFSLAPGSPSLELGGIPDVSSNGAADVFAVHYGFPVIEVYGPAANLGLRQPPDDVDALEFVLCTDGSWCASEWGIRLTKGDWINDGVINLDDFPPFVAGTEPCLSGPKEGEDFAAPSVPCLEVFDFDHDGDVDLADFGGFQRVFGTTPNGSGGKEHVGQAF